MTKPKRILVTGGAGFIGSHVADQLVATGHDLAVVDNLSMGKREYVPAAAQFYPYDIKSPEIVELIRSWRPQVILHFAAQMSVQASVSNPVFDAQENILGSLNLLQAAAEAKVEKFIFSSTGGAIYGDDAPLPAREEDRARPEAPYGIAKLAVEHYLHFYQREHGIIPIALRYANVFGPRQNGMGEAGVVAIFIEKFLAGQQPRINGDGLQTRDFVFVGDIVAANLLALDLPPGRDVQHRHRRRDGYSHHLSQAPGTPGLSPGAGAWPRQARRTAPQRPGQHPGPQGAGLAAPGEPVRGPGANRGGFPGGRGSIMGRINPDELWSASARQFIRSPLAKPRFLLKADAD